MIRNEFLGIALSLVALPALGGNITGPSSSFPSATSSRSAERRSTRRASRPA
ncbi:MAG: hypothetical protein ACYC7A_17780 [Thermoanaerobaculia bacterium]